MATPEERLRIYDSLSNDVDSAAPYRKERSYDGGHTWEPGPESRGEHLMHDLTAALADGRQVDHDGNAVLIQGPSPADKLTRYTPTT